jgi:hypothetical protein
MFRNSNNRNQEEKRYIGFLVDYYAFIPAGQIPNLSKPDLLSRMKEV